MSKDTQLTRREPRLKSIVEVRSQRSWCHRMMLKVPGEAPSFLPQFLVPQVFSWLHHFNLSSVYTDPLCCMNMPRSQKAISCWTRCHQSPGLSSLRIPIIIAPACTHTLGKAHTVKSKWTCLLGSGEAPQGTWTEVSGGPLLPWGTWPRVAGGAHGRSQPGSPASPKPHSLHCYLDKHGWAASASQINLWSFWMS